MIIKQADVKMPELLGYYPNQFLTDEEKLSPEVIKTTLDWFAHIAFTQYKRNRESFAANYDLLKGIISWEHFYRDADGEVKDFMSNVLKGNELPKHIKHYPIMNRPVNTMVGELAKRPDEHRFRAMDDDSRSEEMEVKTELTMQLVMQMAREQIIQSTMLKGEQIADEDLEKLTVEKVQDDITDYTSKAEMWANMVVECMKLELGMKDKGEEMFRDLLIASREFLHLYEDNSKRGFDVEVANPKNVFHSPVNDKKYARSWYYGGLIECMEISEIMEKVPELTKEEIDYLISQKDNGGERGKVSSNFDSLGTGPDTIKYDTYHRLVEQEKDFLAAELEAESEGTDNIGSLVGSVDQTNPLSYKYSVMRVYYLSKKLVGLLTYEDEDGSAEQRLVDETYQEGTPGELAIEWGYVNQWRMGIRIGTEVYHDRPFELLDYCPIIGVIHEVKNTKARSLVDLIKPFQAIYNVCLNQLWELLEKEKGNVLHISIRRIPTPKDADHQDAIAIWEQEAQDRGIIFEDDSPENMRAPSQNQNQARAIDLNRSKEIQSRIELAEWAKQQAMELVGMSEQRMGGVTASESATGTNTALAQSFAQTEPFFAQHEYVMDQVFQAIVDAAQYIESNKPESTLSYITAAGKSQFLKVTPEDIKFRDLHIFSTSRSQDTRLYQELRSLAQPMLQNGATPYEIAELYSTSSIRHLRKIFRDLKQKQEEYAQQAQQNEMQSQQMSAEIEKAKLEQAERFHQDEMKMEKYKTDVNANTAMAREQIKTYFQQGTTDTDGDGVPDITEIAEQGRKAQEMLQARDLENRKMSMEMQKHMDEQQNKKKETKLRERELDIQEKNQKNDIDIQKLKLQEARVKLQATKQQARKKAADAKKPKPKK
jgi:hypothetical protein